MQTVDDVLRELADDPNEYERQGGTVLLVRQGNEHLFELVEVPGSGPSVRSDRSIGGSESFVPLWTYIQRELLDLPRLAKQLVRALERASGKRPTRFIEGPASFSNGPITERWNETSDNLRTHLATAELGTTRLVQLMAAAGQGKTVLLEQAALESALRYQPAEYPIPLLLPVDLLGRYVGTIDDAIAGSLNNTYMFPSLTQRDVSLCVQRRWLVLALDGFDELVARVGARDAFLRISELLDQLQGSGSIIVSARESFFELYQISAAIRTYLQPRTGSYATTVINLLPWGEAQGIEVFRGLGSSSPKQDLSDLLAAFEGDTDIVFHPFFLTRLAELWSKGERFAGASGQSDPLSRTRYVIETFVQRESGEKWIDRYGNPVLTLEGHKALLAGVAGEMWRSGAFRLHVEELKLAAALGLSEFNIPDQQLEGILERTPTHAVLQSGERGFSFLHDRFLHFFLGYHLFTLFRAQESASIDAVLSARELGPTITQWAVWNWRSTGENTAALISYLEGIRKRANNSVFAGNAAYLTAKLLVSYADEPVRLTEFTFIGDAFVGGVYHRVTFDRCRFWNLDLSGSTFDACEFTNCEIGDVLVDESTRFDNSSFADVNVNRLEFSGADILFVPEEIDSALRELGATVSHPTFEQRIPPVRPHADDEVLHTIERLVRTSERATDMNVGELEERIGPHLPHVARIGVETGVFREVAKSASGPRKQFVRFKVDRDLLLRGQIEMTGDAAIDAFWLRVAQKYPRRL